MNAFCVVGDFGTLPEQSIFYTSIGYPISAVCIKISTERPEALDKTCFVLAAIDDKNLLQAVDTNVEMIKDNEFGISVYSEIDRVKKRIAFKKGNINSFGKLVTESVDSSINNWETGSKEMIDLLNIIKSCNGVYGTRFSGLGFKGSGLAFIYFKKLMMFQRKQKKCILQNTLD